MTPDEASRFEREPHFSLLLELRTWDEAAKIEGLDAGLDLDAMADVLRGALA